MKNKYENIFLQDFKNAERNGIDAIKYTFKKLFEENKTNYVYLTDLAIILNERSKKYKIVNTRFSKLYNKLYEELNDYVVQTLKDKKLDYYFNNIS